MELLDVVNENNELLNIVEDRETVHERGFLHREVAFWIINNKNEILLSRRSLNKKQAPGKWEFSAGHIMAGDSPEVTVLKEAYEEVGLKAKLEDLIFIGIQKIEKCFNAKQFNNCFLYTFFIKTNEKIENLTINYDELNELKYITTDELENIIISGDEKYIFTSENYRDYMVIVINELKKRG